MNYAMPDGWIWISGIFFVLGTLAYLVIIAMILMLVKQLKSLEVRLTAMSERIDRVGQKLEQVADTAQESTASIGTSVATIAANLAAVTSSLALPVAKFAPLMGIATMGFRLFQEFRANQAKPKQRTVKIKSTKSADSDSKT
ncbi:MAG: hypothetical protein ACK4P3_04300 [Fimbriimonadaceae bacterium]